MNQSQWSIHCIKDLTVGILCQRKIKGGAYIPTPPELKTKEKSCSIFIIDITMFGTLQMIMKNVFYKFIQLSCFLSEEQIEIELIVQLKHIKENSKQIIASFNTTNITLLMNLDQVSTFLENNQEGDGMEENSLYTYESGVRAKEVKT